MGKLLIADYNEDYRVALTAALKDSYHVLSCRTGTEAWALLNQEHPDILILDLMLPELDGLTLLERAHAGGLHPVVLVVTSIISPYVFGCAQRLGIEYVVRKPCEIEAIASRIKDLSQRIHVSAPKVDPASYITELLLSLTFSTKHNGFSYLRESILLMSKNPAQSVTKVLYPAVAHTFGCQKENVERSIRTAMDYAWEKGDHELWCRYFPDTGQRPTNAVFISRITEALLLEE